MHRRSFLLVAGAALVTRRLPQPTTLGVEVWQGGKLIAHRTFIPYSTGFKISRELLEDDLYGTLSYE